MYLKRCYKVLQVIVGLLPAVIMPGVILGSCESGNKPTDDPYKEFRIGVQSYSFQRYAIQEAIIYVRNLGLHAIEIYPGHFPIDSSDEEREALKAMLSINKVMLVAYGVCELNSDSTLARRYFEFARDMGIETLIINPTPLELEFLERLVREFDVKVAIHNNGPQSRYDKLQDVLMAVAGRDPRIGACVDTEYFMRSGEDPANCAKTLGVRVHLVHLKDMKKKGGLRVSAILGEGDLDMKAFFSALKSLNYFGPISLEYKEHKANPLPGMEVCLTNVRNALQKIKP
jgi:inosose dehydratase